MAVEVNEQDEDGDNDIDTSTAEGALGTDEDEEGPSVRGLIHQKRQVTACGVGIRVWSRPPTPKSMSVRGLGPLRSAF